MRRLLAAIALAFWLLPGQVHAQAGRADDGETEYEPDQRGADEGGDGEEGYEPDQRGVDEGGGDAATDDEEGYEPDQRGVEEGGGDAAEGSYESDQGGGEDTAGGETGYEPDQRGAAEEPLSAPGASQEMFAASDDSEGTSGGRRSIGLDLELWLGLGLTDLGAIDGDNLVRSTQQGGVGGSIGASLRLGIGQLSFGPRFTVSIDPSFVLGAIGLDVRAALMRGAFVPTVRLALSYAFLAGIGDAPPSQPSAAGAWTELGIGFNWRIQGPWVLGADLAGGWLALFREGVVDCVDPCTESDFDVRRDGQSHGLTLRLHVFTGVSF